MSVRTDEETPGRVPRPTDRSRDGFPGRGVRRVPRGPRPEAVPVLTGRACALVGLLDVAAGVFPRFRHSGAHTAAEVLPGVPGPFAAALSLSAGVLLLLLAHGLERGKRRAWRAAVVLLPVGAVAQFACRGSLPGVLVPLAPLALLLLHRDRFAALPDPRGGGRALAHLVLMGAGSLLLGLVVVSAHPGRLVGDPSLADRLTHVLYGLCGLDGPVDHRGDASRTVALCLGALGLLTAVTTVCLAFRPEHPAARLTEEDEARLRALLARHGGRDSPGRFAPHRDGAVVFSPSGRAAVTYRVAGGVMLADGDPIGDVEAWPGAIERFMDEARARSRTPAVTGCSETGGEVWTRETGLVAPEPGDEAVADAGDGRAADRGRAPGRPGVRRRAGAADPARAAAPPPPQDPDRVPVRVRRTGPAPRSGRAGNRPSGLRKPAHRPGPTLNI
ncbi:hypothetical protein SUDANB176_04113 [Streptomyces sp. enrichment culture]